MPPHSHFYGASTIGDTFRFLSELESFRLRPVSRMPEPGAHRSPDRQGEQQMPDVKSSPTLHNVVRGRSPRQSQIDVYIVGRKAQRRPVFFLSSRVQHTLAIGFTTRHVRCAAIRLASFLQYLLLSAHSPRGAFQIGHGQAEVRLWIIRPQLDRSLEIFRSLLAASQIIQK